MTSRKGKKPVKNVPLFYDEVKQKHTLMFTPKAWAKLQQKAEEVGISVSELIERWIMFDNAE